MDNRVLDCLRTLALSTIARYPDMRVQLSPSKGRIANATIEKGQLCLVPCTKSVKALEKPMDEGNAAKIVDPSGKETLYALQAPALQEEFCSSFFVVQGTASEERANVKVEMHEMSFFEPSPKRAFHAKDWPAWIPCYVNDREIAKDGEVLVYKPRHKKEGARARS